jgi:secreted trypsin-like serine protease
MSRGRAFHLLAVTCSVAWLGMQAREAAAGGADPAPVVGGQPAPAGKWPDVAALMDGDMAYCTGTLIAPRTVLTAGHCVDGFNPTQVKLGATDSQGPGEVIEVASSIFFPGWRNTYDVGVLQLAQPATALPRPVATGCVTTRLLTDGAAIHLVGFGATTTEGDDPNTTLMEGDAEIVDADCTPGNGCQPAVSPGGEFVAGGQGVDSCFGDSGGPVYLSTPSGVVLAGVVSRGLDNAPTPCGGGGIYVRPDDMLSWIQFASPDEIALATCPPPPDDPPDEGSGGDGSSGSAGDGAGGDGSDADGGDGDVTGGCSAGGHGGGGGGSGLVLLGLAIAVDKATRPQGPRA